MEKWTIKILIMILMMMSLLSISSLGLSLSSIDTGQWRVSKSTGLESYLAPTVVYNSENSIKISFKIDRSLSSTEQDKLKASIYEGLDDLATISRSKKEINITYRKTKEEDYIRLGSNTLLMEEDNYWALSNNKRTYFISKTGFQVSNEWDNSYADIKWQLDLDGTLYDSAENIWSWSYENNTDFVNLTGTSILENESLEWIANWYLEEGDSYITITLTTNDTSTGYSQRFVHDSVNISNNTIKDILMISTSHADLDSYDDVNYSYNDDTNLKIRDPFTLKYIELIYSQVTDAIVNIQDSMITLYSNLKTMVLGWDDPSEELSPIRASGLNFSDATTSSTTFETIGSAIIIVNQSNARGVIDGTWTGEKLTGSALLTNMTWRVLFDDELKIEIVRSMGLGDKGAMTSSILLENITAGEHNISFQHKVQSDSLETTHVVIILRAFRFLNFSEYHGEQHNISSDSENTEYRLLHSELFNVTSNQSNIFTKVFGTITTDGSEVIDMFQTVNGERSGIFSRSMSGSTDVGSIVQNWQFARQENGTVNWSVFWKGSDNLTSSQLEGNVIIEESLSDNLRKNDNFTAIENVTIPNDGSFHIVTQNRTLNITTENNSIISLFSTTISKDVGGKRDVTIRFILDGQITTMGSTRELDGSADIGSMALQHNFPSLSLGEHNVSVEASLESGGFQILTLSNSTLYIIESVDLESIITATDNPPSIVLISPADNTITNETSITFNTMIIDTDPVDVIENATLYWNITGQFIANGTQIINATSVDVLFNRTILPNTTIIWNIGSSDTSGHDAFAANNFTLTINQSFGIPAIPSPPANVTIETEDQYTLLRCPLADLQTTMLFMFFFIMAFTIVVLGFVFRNGLTGFFGGFMILILSLYVYTCIAAVALILSVIGVWFMGFFGVKGSRGFT